MPDTAPARASATSQPPPTLVDANRLWVDSRVRALVARRVEGPSLVRLGAAGSAGGRCVEVGTGRRALGALVAVEQLGAAGVVAYDVHPASVRAARERLARAVRRSGSRGAAARVRVEVGDGAALPEDAASADLWLSSHCLHHALDWRAVLAEAVRVVRPGGLLAMTEMTSRVVDARWLRAVSRHPGDRFDADQLLAALVAAGAVPLPGGVRRLAGDRVVQVVARRAA